VASDTDISPEAAERIRRERDDLKAQLAEARGALDDVVLRDRMYAHFAQKADVKDPYAAATAAIQVSTLKGVAAEELPQRLDSWLDEQRRLFAAAAQPAEAPPPPSPFQGPNPGAPGYQAKVEPMVVGSPQWNEWVKGKSPQERLDALRRGDAVSTDKTRQAQQTLRTAP
jgi:hypothetical protein